jgi:TolA-binding protein
VPPTAAAEPPPAIDEPAPPIVEAAPPATEPAAETSPSPAPPTVDARRLAAEVALLDRARTALRTGDASGAIAALDEHRRTFADGMLLAEADLVRIEALLVLGRTADATELGHAFLTRFPHSPLAKRVRSLISRTR